MRRIILILLNIVVMALFAACGGGDNETPTIAASVSTSTVSPAGTATSVALPTSQATTPPTTGNVSGQGNRLAIDMGIAGKTGNILDTAVFPPIEEENVRYGGILVLPNQFSDSMDPKRSQNSISRDTIWEYQKLLSWRPNPDDTLIHLEPELAESWKTSTDLKTYTFSLRKGVRWHNLPPVNGREFVADDVVFNMNRYMEKDAISSPNYAQIESIEAPDKYTVVIKIISPNAFLTAELFGNLEYIVPKELVQEGNGSLTTKSIGTGPYILKDFGFRRGSSHVRNPDYWGQDGKGNKLPYTDEVRLPFIQDTATSIAAFRSGQIDAPLSVSNDQAISLANSMKLRLVTSGNLGSQDGLAFNTRKAPWNDVRVRRAFNMLLDKQSQGDSAFGAGKWYTSTPLPWGFVSDKPFTTDEMGPYYKFNPAEAKKLLVAAGFPDGKVKISSPMPVADNPRYMAQIQTAQALWKQQGIEFDLRVLDFTSYNSFWFQRSYEDLMMTHGPSAQPLLNWYAQARYSPTGTQNTSFISGGEIDEIVPKVKVTTDPAKQRELARAIWDFDVNGSWYVWFPNPTTYSVRSFRLHNWATRAGGANTMPFLPWLADAPRTSP